MLDYDMLASPNYIRGIYDGDGDDPPRTRTFRTRPAPRARAWSRTSSTTWFKAQGMKSERGAFDGRSDYVGFTLRGIPSGGVFAGAEGVKTAEQEKIYGGAAGSWYDPCYHQICDNLMTVLTGVPPISAEGLVTFGDRRRREARRPRARWPAARSRASRSSAGAATYGVYYWAMSQGRLRHQAARRQAAEAAPRPRLARPRPPHQPLEPQPPSRGSDPLEPHPQGV